MKVSFATLGCKVNHYETEAMRGLFEQAGWDVLEFAPGADVYVINTCTVTGTSDSKSRQLIARAHRYNPGALIVAVGCYAQSESEAVRTLPGVGLVLGTDGRTQIVARVEAALAHRAPCGQAAQAACDAENEAVFTDAGASDALSPDSIKDPACKSSESVAFVSDIRSVTAFEPLNAVRDGRTRATLKIQDGCANYCAYCIIPYTRGPIRSRPLEDTRAQMERFAAEGYREIVLTGIHLASYGRDLGDCDLLDVLELTRRIDGLARVRLGSLEPKFVDERFVAAVASNEKICRQFHLSMQSGSDTVLARMGRRYTTAEYARAAALLRQAMPESALTTDVIAGFCGETDEEHAQTMAFVREMAFARIHVFPYSIRNGTRAAAMRAQVPQHVREARAGALIRLGKELTQEFLRAQLGRTDTVLIESDGTGYTGNYARVQVCPPQPEGALVRVRLKELCKETILGEEVT